MLFKHIAYTYEYFTLYWYILLNGDFFQFEYVYQAKE